MNVNVLAVTYSIFKKDASILSRLGEWYGNHSILFLITMHETTIISKLKMKKKSNRNKTAKWFTLFRDHKKCRVI